MKHDLNRLPFRAEVWRNWQCATFLLCLALSAYKAGKASTINFDGLIYLNAAQVFVEQGFKAAAGVFNWPFYSVLIGLTHQAFPIGYETAAYAINALLLALLSVAFVALYRQLTGERGRPWIASAVILLSPQLADYRSFIIRDIGYWALSFWAVLFFVKLHRKKLWRDALGWQACIVGAIAFRIEGAALAALLPFWCLFQRDSRSAAWLRANSLFLLAALTGGALIATGAIPAPSNSRLEQLYHFVSPSNIFSEFALRVKAVANHVQAFHAPQDAQPLLFGGVLFLFLHKLATSLGLLFSLLLVWAFWRRRPRLLEQPMPVIWFAAGVTSIPLLAFGFNDLFLSTRNMGLVILLLSLPMARAAELFLFEDGRILQRPYWAIALALTSIAMLVDSLIQTGPSKRYLREGGEWARDHLPATASLCSEDPTLLFYTGRERGAVFRESSLPCKALDLISQRKPLRHGAFLIKINHKDSDKLARLQALLNTREDLTIAKRFGNDAGDSLYIVAPSQPAP